jgi:hypothetical protein
MIKFWNKKEVKDGEEFSLDTAVELSNGKSATVREMVEFLNAEKKKEEVKTMTVKVGGKEMTVSELTNAYLNACKKNKANEVDDDDNDDDDDKKTKNEGDEDDKDEDKLKEKNSKSKKNDDDDDKGKKNKKNSKETRFNDLDKAERNFFNNKNGEDIVVDTINAQVARGSDRYGSKK